MSYYIIPHYGCASEPSYISSHWCVLICGTFEHLCDSVCVLHMILNAGLITIYGCDVSIYTMYSGIQYRFNMARCSCIYIIHSFRTLIFTLTFLLQPNFQCKHKHVLLRCDTYKMIHCVPRVSKREKSQRQTALNSMWVRAYMCVCKYDRRLCSLSHTVHFSALLCDYYAVHSLFNSLQSARYIYTGL